MRNNAALPLDVGKVSDFPNRSAMIMGLRPF